MKPLPLGLQESLGTVFLTPLGLAALVAIIPVLLLYLLKPDPSRIRFPAVEFLVENRERSRHHPALRRLMRSTLLLLQLLAIAAIAVSLAAPYVSVAEERTVSETVLVVDASASMATESGGVTRFDRAVLAAQKETTAQTSVVVAGADAGVVAQRVPKAGAKSTLQKLRATGTASDLSGAIDGAASVAGTNARIVVLSDFADDGWRTAVSAARARGHHVSLRQFDGGGAGNVGVIDRSFSDGKVSVRVKNFGDAKATRKITLGGESRSVTLGPGDVARKILPVPAGGGRLRLSPSDSFPVDDQVAVAAPDEPTIDVLVLTNHEDRNRPLITALSVIRGTQVTVKQPPASVTDSYDVVVFSDVDPGRLLDGTRQVARETLSKGGGVVIQAQPNRSNVDYGGISPFVPKQAAKNPAIRQPEPGPLTADVTFPAPATYVKGELRTGRPLLRTRNGTALLALAPATGGKVLYYGYPSGGSAFAHNYRYPVFWKRAVYELTGRKPLSELNRKTGERLRFPGKTTVNSPTGSTEASAVTLDQTGFYEAGGRRYAASLSDVAESDVAADPISGNGDSDGSGEKQESRMVPRELTPLTAGLAGLVVLAELGFLRYRGDL